MKIISYKDSKLCVEALAMLFSAIDERITRLYAAGDPSAVQPLIEKRKKIDLLILRWTHNDETET